MRADVRVANVRWPDEVTSVGAKKLQTLNHDDTTLSSSQQQRSNSTTMMSIRTLSLCLLASARCCHGFSVGIVRNDIVSVRNRQPPSTQQGGLHKPMLSPIKHHEYRVEMPRARQLAMSTGSDEPEQKSSSLPFFLDPATKGGVVVYSILLFLAPIFLYNFVVGAGILDEISAGRLIGVGFTIVASLAWVSTYVFRVATKDMTYVRSIGHEETRWVARAKLTDASFFFRQSS
jgi:Protein of unknown function (DUF3007)